MSSFRSRIYDCLVHHSRVRPRKHRFDYRYFTLCLDLDEVDDLSRTSLYFGFERWKVLRFVPSDSIFGQGSSSALAIKDSVIELGKNQGVEAVISKVEMVAHARTFGYSFNPAAFFFAYDASEKLVFAVVEVTNTYREKKVFFVPADPATGVARSVEQKLFYVSPFADLTNSFAFDLRAPDAKLSLTIDSRLRGKESNDSPLEIHASVRGDAKVWNEKELFLSILRFPLVTLKVISGIHFQALLLYLKRVPYFRKADRTALQQGGLP